MIRTIVELKDLPQEIQSLIKQRMAARENKNWAESDQLRQEIEKLGYTLEDTDEGIRIYS